MERPALFVIPFAVFFSLCPIPACPLSFSYSPLIGASFPSWYLSPFLTTLCLFLFSRRGTCLPLPAPLCVSILTSCAAFTPSSAPSAPLVAVQTASTNVRTPHARGVGARHRVGEMGSRDHREGRRDSKEGLIRREEETAGRTQKCCLFVARKSFRMCSVCVKARQLAGFTFASFRSSSQSPRSPALSSHSLCVLRPTLFTRMSPCPRPPYVCARMWLTCSLERLPYRSTRSGPASPARSRTP